MPIEKQILENTTTTQNTPKTERITRLPCTIVTALTLIPTLTLTLTLTQPSNKKYLLWQDLTLKRSARFTPGSRKIYCTAKKWRHGTCQQPSRHINCCNTIIGVHRQTGLVVFFFCDFRLTARMRSRSVAFMKKAYLSPSLPCRNFLEFSWSSTAHGLSTWENSGFVPRHQAPKHSGIGLGDAWTF